MGALLARGAFQALKKRIDPAESGGAPLLGIRGCCVIGHGKSDPVAIREGVRVAAEYWKSGVNDKITKGVARLTPARADAKNVADGAR
jgi:glycerol-3-phosphate acyltransferase PlsX